jgi:hypothetical protein
VKLFLALLSLMTVHPSHAQELQDLDFFSNGQGMHLTPGILNRLESFRGHIEGTRADDTVLRTLARRWGIQEQAGKLVGIKTVRYHELPVGVLGCVACHSGKAAGQYIIGIGNKNIDPGQIGLDGLKIEEAYRKMTDTVVGRRKKSAEYRALEESSIRLMKKLADPRMSASTQGLVPVSLVGSWFYEMAGEEIPAGAVGATKVPSWFGFGKKLEVGQFADAIGKGHPPGWIIGVEITAGQTPDAVREYFPKVEAMSEQIAKLVPPRYPFFIDPTRAARGKTRFEQTCAKCHGTYTYQADGAPVYQTPKVVPQSVIGTDPDRLDYVTSDFLQKVRQSPLSDLIQLSEYAGTRQYIAPRLHAIWARFPYLHNGSVPTLRALLEPAARRPRVFSLRDAGELARFDPRDVGLKSAATPREQRQLLRDQRQRRRWVYDTALKGQSNQGHEKYVDLPNADKDDLIEYLKTL